MRILVGTADGLHEAGEAGPVAFAGHDVTALSGADGAVWALVDGRTVHVSTGGGPWKERACLDGPDGTCLLALSTDEALVGTAGAHLYRLRGANLERVAGFDAAPGRDSWYTPWGGPPDTRSMTRDAAGALYANVHVGGVLRSEDGEAWEPTSLSIHTDVHEVRAVPGRPGHVLAAAAEGLASTTDGGDTWEVTAEGLDATYMRAVLVAGDAVIATSSRGPGGADAAAYRRPLDGSAPFERLSDGLPGAFEGNIDTGWLDARGETVVLAAPDGDLYRSAGPGEPWERIVTGLPAVRWVSVLP